MMTITRFVVSICFPFPRSTRSSHGAGIDHVAFTVRLWAAAIRSNFWPFCLNHIAPSQEKREVAASHAGFPPARHRHCAKTLAQTNRHLPRVPLLRDLVPEYVGELDGIERLLENGGIGKTRFRFRGPAVTGHENKRQAARSKDFRHRVDSRAAEIHVEKRSIKFDGVDRLKCCLHSRWVRLLGL